LFPDIVDVCIEECNAGNVTVWVQIANQGYTDVEDDFALEIWGETSTGLVLLHTTNWTSSILSGVKTDATEIELTGVPTPLYDIVAMVDYGNDAPGSEISECHEDNNENRWGAYVCL
jgi:hypothetical protein